MTATNGDLNGASSSQLPSSSSRTARRAKQAFNAASRALPAGQAGDAVRRALLHDLRARLQVAKAEVQAANEADVSKAEKEGLSPSLISRLDLFAKKGKWQGMLDGIDQVAQLPTPLDDCTYAKRLADPTPGSAESGALDLYRVTCPIGVILCIFEARPEVIVNIASLCIKSGNAAILKGGKESQQTAVVLSRILRDALENSSQLPQDLVQTVETRQDVADLLQLDQYIDLVIPRGSNALVRSIQRQSSIPVMGHADGICCAYVHEDAQAASTVANIVDSKIDYPAACNALETILIHRSHLTPKQGGGGLLHDIISGLLSAGVTIHADAACHNALASGLESSAAAGIKAATDGDFDTEFLSLDVAIKAVDSLDEAVDHINEHGSHHTDVLFTASSTSGAPTNASAARFARAVDSANVLINASTRFSDGFRYGFGTEVGISTGKIHARGPVGLEGLVTYKYIVQGQGGRQTCADFSKVAPDPQARTFAHMELKRQYPSL